ncbi:hypothetical protein K8I28_17530 [bacterium]|nr:hypothetical protein [bacterium]
MKFTELALTLGSWGRSPLSSQVQIACIDTLHAFSRTNNLKIVFECYHESDDDQKAANYLLKLEKNSSSIESLIRVRPRSDRFRKVAEMGGKRVVFEHPVSAMSVMAAFGEDGFDRGLEFCQSQSIAAIVEGLDIEIALTDITRGDFHYVENLTRNITAEAQARGKQVCWRLADSFGLGDPFEKRMTARSLHFWVEFLHHRCGIDINHISVQVADTFGLSLANLLALLPAGIQPVSSMFGTGIGSGWTATELLLVQALGRQSSLAALVGMRELLGVTEEHRDTHRPLTGINAFEVKGGAKPETISSRAEKIFPFNPDKLTGIEAIPLLDDLSGHAGLLHIAHNNNSDIHIETEDQRVIQIYEEYEKAFLKGRQQPVSWAEVKKQMVFLEEYRLETKSKDDE